MTDALKLPGAGHPEWLSERARGRLTRRLRDAVARARRAGGPVVVSVTERVAGELDPTAVLFASRRAGEPWFCLEQPDRHDGALAGLGQVSELAADGPDRFSAIARGWRSLSADALADPPGEAGGSGLAGVGGFAFDPNGGRSPSWQGFAAASIIVPEVVLARRGSQTWITLNVAVRAGDIPAQLVSAVDRRLAELRLAPLPLFDPAPVGRFTVHSPMPPAHYEEAVARAVERIRAGELQKIVLARRVDIEAPVAYDPGPILGILREEFPSCFVFGVGRGDATFLGASPELLIRRDGERASTVALAGSTGRSADPAVDDHLGEQLLQSRKNREENAIVARRIRHALDPYSVWVTSAPEPELIRVANIQHLAMPIRAQLAASVGAIELAGVLHPTPAVGAEPAATGLRLIPALEGLDRGWYAGALGWVDQSGDGEFCVALRSALLRDRHAACYAGCGIVGDSDPAAELAETEVKLKALLPVLAS